MIPFKANLADHMTKVLPLHLAAGAETATGCECTETVGLTISGRGILQ